MVIRLWLISFLGLSMAYVESLAGSGNVEVLDDRLKKAFEPQVAVKCGYLNQYMLENGHWSPNKDGDATCLNRKEEILSICRKAYPEKEITNIVESASNVLIENWCQDGVDGRTEECKTKLWVKPYRCIVGSFQSDALLVPEGCNFSHTYDKRECKEFSFWNQTAQEACALKGLTARSFGMLVPCGIDLFSGVEYVCCPLEMEPMREADSSERAIEEERSRTRHSPSTAPVKPGDDSDNGDNWQDEYLRIDDEQTEHEKYENAMQKLEKHHQDRIDKMMKEWTDVSTRYKDLKKTDPQAAKKLKADLMSRVRKTVSALEEEFNDQKKQLTELHQQRIDVQLNERKRQSMDDYLDAIQERHPKAKKLYNTLEKYIRAEEKDREHAINRYRHLLDADANSAEQTEPTVLAHLRDLDQRINESMKMLNRVPENIAKEVQRKARLFWAEHRKELFGEGTNDELLTKNKQKGAAERNRQQISHQRELEEKFDQLESVDNEDDDLQSEPESETEMTTTARPIIDQGGLDFVPLDRKTPIENVEIFSTPSTTTVDPDDEDDTVDEDNSADAEDAENEKENNEVESREREEVGPLQKFQDVSSSIAYSKLHREEQSQYSSVQRLVQEDGATAGKVLYIGMGLVGVAFFAGLMLLVVVLRRRSPRKEGFSPVDTFASPEERHVANMQAHGYTNPFFNHVHQYSKA
jgi:amyloid beta A4 protein